MDKTVLILLTSYNGEKYVGEMIDSLLNQDYKNIRIVLSDDGSSDSTVEILQKYAQLHPDKIIHYHSGLRFGCAQKHFMHLLCKFHDAPYIMFCDQDDVWHCDKVSKTLQKMQQIEVDVAIPAMVHTDLRVVDAELNEIATSFCQHMDIDGNRMSLNHLLVQNVVTGCTMMINNALAKIASREVAVDAMNTIVMHDWWIALIASACGVTGFLDEATIDYRQHGNNSVGAKDIRSLQYILTRLKSNKMRDALRDAAKQGEVFLGCFGDLLNVEQQKVLKAFASTQYSSIVKRDAVYFKYGLLKSSFTRRVAQLLGW